MSSKSSNAKQKLPRAQTLRQRAAQARDAAERTIRREEADQVTDQPQAASLPEGSAAESHGHAFQVPALASHHARQGHPEENGRADAADGRAPHREQHMGRHETFENAAPIADELLTGTILGRARAADLPEPGSDEAVAAFEVACREFTRLTPLSDEDYAALRIGDTHTLWTTEWIEAARRGDYSRFPLREFEIARAKTPAELTDLLVLAARRDLQFAEAEQSTRIKTLYALAYPDGEDPEPLPDPEGDHAHVAIAEHRQAYAEWKPLGDAWNEMPGGPGWNEAREAQDEPNRVMVEAFGELIDTVATTPAGLRALAAYLPGAVHDANCVEVEEDARRALRSMCRGVLAIVEDAEADDALLSLGRQFEVARAREIAACEVCNAAQAEADRHEPPRPACLTYRASDNDLSVYGYMVMAEALEGREVGFDDVARLRRKMPMMHEVLRPIREGERAHIDHPGRKFDIVPHPEAQARAEAIVAAWDAWRAEMHRVCAEHVTPEMDREAEEAGDAAADLARQIAELPARTGAGLRVKLRALVHYRASVLRTDLPEEPDPDQRLSHSLRQDIERDATTDVHELATVESAAPMHFDAYTFESPLRSPREWVREFSDHALGMHVADKTLRMTKPEMIAFIRGAADRGDGADEALHKALLYAQERFDKLAVLLDVARSRYLVAASALQVEREAHADLA